MRAFRKKRFAYIGAVLALLLAAGASAYLFRTPNAAGTANLVYKDISDRLGHAAWNSLMDSHISPGACVLDANGDGRDDIFIPGIGYLNVSPERVPGFVPGNHLFLNRGTDAANIPLFEEVGETAGVRNSSKLGTGCAAADYDNDGDMDIVVTNATEAALHSAYGRMDYGRGLRVYPPDYFKTDMTDGKYDFPQQGGVTLFENLGGEIPRFADRTLSAKLTRGGNGTSVAWADLDNDGWVDLHVLNYSDFDFMGFHWPTFAGQWNILYRNNGNGTFEDVTEGSGIAGQAEYVVNQDGEIQYGWRADVLDSKGRVVGDPAGNSLALAFLDYDEDGFLDLVTADDIPGNIRIFRNRGGFKFEETSDSNDMRKGGAWMGFGIGDVNGDGRLDIFATNNGGPSGSRYRTLEERKRFQGTSTFMGNIHANRSSTPYHGLWVSGPGGFRNIAGETEVDWGIWEPDTSYYPEESGAPVKPPKGLQKGEFGFGGLIYDYDNDGDGDIAWIGNLWRAGTQQQTQRDSLNPGRLLQNEGGGRRFVNVANEAGLLDASRKENRHSAENGRGLAVGDFNDDGFHDVLMTNAGGWDSPFAPALSGTGLQFRPLGVANEYRPGPTFLYLAEPNGNNWLKVKLEGTSSNRSAIGARLTLRYSEYGRIKEQVREVRAGESYASQNSLGQIFGLGGAERAAELVIRWPSGKTQTLANIEANQRLFIKEQ